MRRILACIALLLMAVLVEMAIYQAVPNSSGDAETPEGENVPTRYIGAPEHAMFCMSSVRFSNADGTQYRMVTVLHPKGGRDVVEESIRSLPQRGIPDPWPSADMLEHYQIEATLCYSWYEAFWDANAVYLGRALSMLEDPDEPITVFDMRRVVMKIYFKDKWQIAEDMFPLRGE